MFAQANLHQKALRVPKPDLQREKSKARNTKQLSGSTAEVARGMVSIPNMLMAFAMGMFCGRELV